MRLECPAEAYLSHRMRNTKYDRDFVHTNSELLEKKKSESVAGKKAQIVRNKLARKNV